MAIKTKMTDLSPSRSRNVRRIKLLSGGFLNGKCFPDGMIDVYPWDNLVDEWVATKRNAKGKNFLYSILPKVANLNGCDIGNFIASEVMTVLMVSRSILRKDTVTYDFECPSCDESGQNTIKIPDQLEKVGEKTLGWPGHDIIHLPECGDDVKVCPLTIAKELGIPERISSACGDSGARVLAAVVDIGGGVPDNEHELVAWFNALSPADSAYLLEEFENTQPHLSRTLNHVCDSCGAKFSHMLRLDVDFFRRANGPSDRTKVENPVHPSVQEQGSVNRPVKSARASDPKNSSVA